MVRTGISSSIVLVSSPSVGILDNAFLRINWGLTKVIRYPWDFHSQNISRRVYFRPESPSLENSICLYMSVYGRPNWIAYCTFRSHWMCHIVYGHNLCLWYPYSNALSLTSIIIGHLGFCRPRIHLRHLVSKPSPSCARHTSVTACQYCVLRKFLINF